MARSVSVDVPSCCAIWLRVSPDLNRVMLPGDEAIRLKLSEASLKKRPSVPWNCDLLRKFRMRGPSQITWIECLNAPQFEVS